MRKKLLFGIILWTMVCGLWTNEAEAEVVIKIRAVNPLDTETVTSIKSYLPKGIGENDITRNISI